MKKNEKKIINSKTRPKSYKSALKRHKNRKRKEVLILISIIFFAVATFIFINSNLVQVKNINVEGTSQIEKAELLSVAQLDTDLQIWQVEESKIESLIKEKYNIISEVKVSKKLLNTINIDVKEKKILVQELNSAGQYVKLLEDGKEYHGRISKNYTLPILSGFIEDGDKKAEVLKNLSELNENVLYKISEISLDKDNKNIANVFMQDGQKVKVTTSNFSSKLNYYLQMEKHIENKTNTVLNLVNGAYLETSDSINNKETKINEILQDSLEISGDNQTTVEETTKRN